VAEYLAPGVYVEETSFRAPSIAGVGTTTTGFVGPTSTGPVGQTPQLLTSFGDFANVYGGYDDLSLVSGTANAKNRNYMALSVKAFFDNGGSRLYVSRVFASKGDAGTASGGTKNVKIAGRFAGSFLNGESVKVSLNAVKIQNVGNLPPGSLVAAVSQPVGTLAGPMTAGDATATVSAPFTATLPASVMVDSEVISVTAVDAGQTKLTVTRGANAAAHAAGATMLSPLGALGAAMDAATTTLTLAVPLSSITPTAVQVESEQMGVTAIDATNTKLTVTRGSNGTTAAAHAAAAAVFSPNLPVTLYANGNSAKFTNGGNALPSPAPPSYQLTLRVIAPSGSGSLLVYDGLGLDPAHPNYLGVALGANPPRHIDALQNQVAVAVTSGVNAIQLAMELFPAWSGPPSIASNSLTLNSGNDGAEPTSSDYDNALKLLEGLEDIAIVAAPGSSAFDQHQAIINSLITHVSRERAYRIAVLDTPPNQIASDNEDVRAHIDSSYAALYAPWIVTPNPLYRTGSTLPAEVAVPPSGFMAGIYARNDEQTSVAKSPANEVVLGAVDFERNITFAEQSVLNPLGINCLRYFPDRGFRVWGARTATSDSEFMYVNVRRYLIYLEHSIDNGSQWAVFENNGPALWARVKDSIDSFLRNEFAEGRLLGNSPAEAYFVRCDRTTMTQNDLDNGRLVCLIGVALLKPAEFVIFRIGQFTADARA
jgi:phage tail sheath protein FI